MFPAAGVKNFQYNPGRVTECLPPAYYRDEKYQTRSLIPQYCVCPLLIGNYFKIPTENFSPLGGKCVKRGLVPILTKTIPKIGILLFLALLVSTHAEAQAQQSPALVMQQPADCINTFILRVNVAASNTGAAYGTFDNSQIQMLRRGTNRQNCRIEMVQWGPNGQVEDQKLMQCFFEYPLGN